MSECVFDKVTNGTESDKTSEVVKSDELLNKNLNFMTDVAGGVAFFLSMLFNIFGIYVIGRIVLEILLLLFFICLIILYRSGRKGCIKEITFAGNDRFNSLLSTYTGFAAILFCFEKLVICQDGIICADKLFLIVSVVVFFCYIIGCFRRWLQSKQSNNDVVDKE